MNIDQIEHKIDTLLNAAYPTPEVFFEIEQLIAKLRDFRTERADLLIWDFETAMDDIQDRHMRIR